MQQNEFMWLPLHLLTVVVVLPGTGKSGEARAIATVEAATKRVVNCILKS